MLANFYDIIIIQFLPIWKKFLLEMFLMSMPSILFINAYMGHCLAKQPVCFV